MTKRRNEKDLTELEYYVMKEQGTERPFQNEFDDHYEEGLYVDKLSGKPLFSSKDKFNAMCGWPSFSKTIANDVSEHFDDSHGMRRVEVRSDSSDSHLGHVFPDGPKELGGMRYCINSAALDFIPKEKLEEEGYGQYSTLFE